MHFPSCEALAMAGIRFVGGTSGARPQSPEKLNRPCILGIDSWMPSQIQAISPLVDRLMLLIERSQCVPGEEHGVEIALREALANAVVHGNQKGGKVKVQVRCRCGPGNEVSIVVTDHGKGFDFRDVSRLTSELSQSQRGQSAGRRGPEKCRFGE